MVYVAGRVRNVEPEFPPGTGRAVLMGFVVHDARSETAATS